MSPIHSVTPTIQFALETPTAPPRGMPALLQSQARLQTLTCQESLASFTSQERMPELPPNQERPNSHAHQALPEFMPGSGRVGPELALRHHGDILPIVAAGSVNVVELPLAGPPLVRVDGASSRTLFSPEPVIKDRSIEVFGQCSRAELYRRCTQTTRELKPSNTFLRPPRCLKSAFVPQASRILPRLWLSDAYTASCNPVLQELHITHIVSCIETKMNLGLFQVDMPPSYHSPNRKPSPTGPHKPTTPIIRHVAVEDSRTTRLDYYFDGVCQFIDDALSNPLANVLVHCYMGMSRSSTLIAAYILWRGHGGRCRRRPGFSQRAVETAEDQAAGKIDGEPMTYLQAIQYCRERRAVVQPNPGFVLQLHDYEVYLRKRAARLKL